MRARTGSAFVVALFSVTSAWGMPVEHTPPGCLPMGKLVALEGKLEVGARTTEARLFFRGAGSSLWYSTPVEVGFGGSLSAVLPRTGPMLSEVEYFFTTTGGEGEPAATPTYRARVATPSVCEAEGLSPAETIDTAQLTIGLPEYGIPAVPEGFLEEGIMGVLMPDGERRDMVLARAEGGTMKRQPNPDRLARKGEPTIEAPKKKSGSMGLVLGGLAGAAALGAAAGGGGGGGGGGGSAVPPPTTASISGSITASSGGGLGGVTVSLGGTNTTTTSSSGAYSFSGLSAGTYTVTPSLAGYSFSPPSRTNTVISGDSIGNQNFSATAVPFCGQFSVSATPDRTTASPGQRVTWTVYATNTGTCDIVVTGVNYDWSFVPGSVNQCGVSLGLDLPWFHGGSFFQSIGVKRQQTVRKGQRVELGKYYRQACCSSRNNACVCGAQAGYSLRFSATANPLGKTVWSADSNVTLRWGAGCPSCGS